jgi:DNA-binding response OmpR family regulator
MSANDPISVQNDNNDNSVVLIVGRGPLSEQLETELRNHKLDAEMAESGVVVEAIVAAAPDLVVLVGDAARNNGKEILQLLADNPAGAVVPIVVVSESKTKEPSKAFRHGVVSTIASDTPVNEIAERIVSLVDELPERPGECTGAVEEATLDELVGLLTNELRSGVLSVKSRDEKRNDQGARIVLRAGHSVSEKVDSFVERVKPMIVDQRGVSYAFQENSSGRVDSVAPPGDPPRQGVESESFLLERRRILVVDSERTRADRLAKALREHKALVVTVCGTEVDLERARSLDPEVVIVDSCDIDGACSQVMETLQQDIRMRWASVLISTKEQVWPDDREQPNISPLANKIAQLNKPDEQLRKRAQSSTSFDTRLEIVGPSRMLRVLAATGKTLRVSVKHPRAAIDIELGDDTVLGARGTLKEEASRAVSGTTALAAFMTLASGRVRVSEVSAPELSDLVSPVDLMLSMAAEEASPIALSIPPQPLITRPVEVQAQPPVEVKQNVPEPWFAGSQKVPGSVSSVSTIIVSQRPADPIEPSIRPKSRSNWWLGKAVPVTCKFSKEKAPRTLGRSDEDTQEVLIHQSLLEDNEHEGAEAAVQRRIPEARVDSASAELAAEAPISIPMHGEGLRQIIDNIKSRIRSIVSQYARAVSIHLSNLSQRLMRISFASATGTAGTRIGDRFRPIARGFTSQAVSQILRKSRERLLQLPRRTTIIVITVIGLLVCFSSAASFLLYREERPGSQPEPRLSATKVKHERSKKTRAENTTVAPALPAIEEERVGERPSQATEETGSELRQSEQDIQAVLDEDALEAEAVADLEEPLVGDTADEPVVGDDADDRDDMSADPVVGSRGVTNRGRVRQIREADKFVIEGHRYWRRGRLGMAESSYLQALQVYPKYPRALVGMVRVHLQRRASGEALRSAKMLVRRKPQPSLYRLLLGDAYALDGDFASARTEWRIASRRGNRTARSRLRAKND